MREETVLYLSGLLHAEWAAPRAPAGDDFSTPTAAYAHRYPWRHHAEWRQIAGHIPAGWRPVGDLSAPLHRSDGFARAATPRLVGPVEQRVGQVAIGAVAEDPGLLLRETSMSSRPEPSHAVAGKFGPGQDRAPEFPGRSVLRRGHALL